jgi:hypothetical protein
MAQDAKISVPRATWTELTDTDTAGDITLALLNDATVYLQATTGATAPTTNDGMPLMSFGDGWSEATIVEKFPGVASADRLWAYSPNADVQIYISHA